MNSWLDDVAEMSRRAAETKFGVQDQPVPNPSLDNTPEQFEYDGQLYVVRRKISEQIAVGELGHEDAYVVEAVPVDLHAARTFNLKFRVSDGSWTIEPEENG